MPKSKIAQAIELTRNGAPQVISVPLRPHPVSVVSRYASDPTNPAALDPASANVLHEMSREQKFAVADLVVIAKPASCPKPKKEIGRASCRERV